MDSPDGEGVRGRAAHCRRPSYAPAPFCARRAGCRPDRPRWSAAIRRPPPLSLLGAAWTLGSIKQLAEAGAASATYYETTGWCGVMQAESGVVYPVYHVLADVGEFADAEVLPVRSSNKLRVDGLALQTGDRRRILAANLTCDTRRVLVRRVRAAGRDPTCG